MQLSLSMPSAVILGLLVCGVFSEVTEEVVSPETGVEDPPLQSVLLQKQYVPVVRNGKTVAYKTAYFGPVSISAEEPRQAFTVVFDTGSGHFILPSTACHSETCMKHRRYNRTLSRNAMDIDQDGTPMRPDAVERDNVAIGFGTGEVLGEFVHEVICVGGETSAAPVALQAVAGTEASTVAPGCVGLRAVVATEMTDDPFGLFDFDGVLGLGLDALALNPQFSFFAQLVAQHPAMQPRFAVFLSRHDGGESVITFGGHNKRLAASELEWAPVALKELGYWQVQIKSVRIGDRVLEDCEDGSCRAILDTGTSLLGVPKQSARAMHKMLARPVPEGSYTAPSDIDCRSVPGQAMSFELVDGPTVTLGSEDYSRPTPFNMSTGNNQSRLICRSLLLPVDMEAPLGPRIFIWGEPVLRRYLTVYDFAQKQVGFALAREPPPSDDASQAPSAVGAPPAGSLLSGAPLSALPSVA